MIYELHFHPLALKEWKKLGKNLQEEFKKVLKRRLENPHVASAGLRGALKNCYKIKLRQSGYRLVYQVNDNKLIVTVIAVGKRNKNVVYDDADNRQEDS
ncbi:type II toxin-antitoxin system RelE/ParE family toxin [Legionella pneumophila]|uniref:type II toxin-antitoxin system RelE family toxin n=1 Tax=Legionella pneumophila TaxID=446 RepID=UPI001374FC48|nr:type II toxin-antitoxin system RelE/ParE family toxin [Legionella pneumophila]HAT8815373.1 type II toxin-antitoxin system mRNA interferase toxin, RelE/StbE family [Legionella pneumophila subsp. pneumophila]MCZ4804442.1 type II toxin-antitoxin system RelE/ParE family toxin [Legionella pneumophila]MDW9179401.1 type II toxin-antitoxin system RelE/ParE family toxin [Legionella pneumophila]HAT1823814.1 type II toxin-antitoxin system RelE/ParE family toxin [Legionella pneumophila]HAT1864158.1 typ